MNYWIFIATRHTVDGETFEAEEILKQRMHDKFWGLGEKTPNRRALQSGDHVVFYLGLPKKEFAASATISKGSFPPSEEERERLSHGKKFYRAEYGVLLENGEIWEQRRAVEDLVPNLNFIENKEFWFTYLQGGVRQIAEEDFRTILEGRTVEGVRAPLAKSETENQSQFALESHLEDFLDQNWENIRFLTNLNCYQVDDQGGRQFPAGPWSIDFLCTEKDTGDFVIVELKRGKSSDATVGQILRYMSWVKENLAKPHSKIRGIIIAKEIDEAMHYAVKDLDNVSVLTYKVDFTLSISKK